MFSRTHLPRSTGEVRFAYDDTVNTLACVRMPPRGVPVRSTLRNSGSLHVRDAVEFREPLVQEAVVRVDELQDAAVFPDDVFKSRSVSLRMDMRRYSSNSGNFSRSGVTDSNRRVSSHWPPKFSTRARAFGSFSIRLISAPKHLRFAECAGIRRPQQLSIRHAAPEEVRQPRCQFVIR